MGYRSKYSTYAANWTGYLVVSGIQSVGQCYAALQWYSDGQPVSTVAKVIGTLDPGRAVNVVLSTPISESQRGGTASFHVWSGANELKTSQVENPSGKAPLFIPPRRCC
jgi:hypothetical protein